GLRATFSAPGGVVALGQPTRVRHRHAGLDGLTDLTPRQLGTGHHRDRTLSGGHRTLLPARPLTDLATDRDEPPVSALQCVEPRLVLRTRRVPVRPPTGLVRDPGPRHRG